MKSLKKFFKKPNAAKQRKKAEDACRNGNRFCNSENYEEGIKCFEEAIKLDPSYIYPYYNIAYTLNHDLSRPEEALVWYDKTLEIDPKHKEAPYAKALLLDILGRQQEALIAYEKAIEIVPEDSRAYNGKGNILDNLGRYQEAIEFYEKAIECEPTSPMGYNGKGNMLKRLGRYEEALAFYNKAIEIAPDALYYCSKAIALNALGRQIEAFECLNISYNLLKEGNIDKSLSDDNIEYICYHLSELLPKLHEFKQASMEAEKQIEALDENNPEAKKAISDFNDLKKDGQQAFSSAIASLNINKAFSEDAKASAEEKSVDELIAQMHIMQGQLAALVLRVEQQEQEIAVIHNHMQDFAIRLGVEQSNIGKMMDAMQGFESAMPFLLQLKERLEQEEHNIETIMNDDSQKIFFETFGRILNSTYLASSVVATEIVKNNKKGALGVIANMLGVASVYVPIFGGGAMLLSSVLKSVDDVIQKNYLHNFANFASSSSQMEEISKNIAIGLINKNFYSLPIKKHNDSTFSNMVNSVSSMFSKQNENIDPLQLSKKNAETIAYHIVDRIFKGDFIQNSEEAGVSAKIVQIVENISEVFDYVDPSGIYNPGLIGDNNGLEYSSSDSF